MDILCDDHKRMTENIIESGIKYLENNQNIKSMVIGLSGGIDSTLVAALAREICDILPQYKLFGYSIPIESNKESEIEIARQCGESFCHTFKEVRWIEKIYKVISRFKGAKTLSKKIRLGNIKARIRMMYLYDKAHEHNGIVLSTDNLSEFNLGFWTLHGDVGDLGLIQAVWKTELYGISCYLWDKYHDMFKENSERYIHRKLRLNYKLRRDAIYEASRAIPTDGLGITDSDFDQLEVGSYREADEILIKYFNGSPIYRGHPVIQRHLKYAFKRNNPYNIPRENIVPEHKKEK